MATCAGWPTKRPPRQATWSSSRCRGTATPTCSGSVAGPLAGKVVVDCVNPLGFDKQGAFALPVSEGSAAEQAAALLPDSTVVAAFHHVSAAVLDDSAVTSVDTDVLVLGDDRDATDLVPPWPTSYRGCEGSTAVACATPTRSRP